MRLAKTQGTAARRLLGIGAALAITALAGMLLASAAAAGVITPEAGPSPNAQETNDLYKIILIMALVVIGAVWLLLFYSLIKFRGGRGRDHKPDQIRGNSALELGWTLAPVAIVIAIIVVVLVMLPDIKNPAASGPNSVAQARGLNAAVGQPAPPGGNGLEIKVSGQQYLWRYQYPNGAVSFHDMVVPVDQTVVLKIEATDVAHSWWIPKLGGKFDALPGLENETWFKATETGSFKGQCAELCGSNHAFMTARVIVVQPEEYKQWVAQLKSDIGDAIQQQQKQSKEFTKQDI